MKDFFEKNQFRLALLAGYFLVFLLAFGLGRITVYMPTPPDITVEEPGFDFLDNNNADIQGTQSSNSQITPQGGIESLNGECPGMIKGNIGSSEKIYHMPGGSFYNRTKAEKCFETEEQALAAGFRKSLR